MAKWDNMLAIVWLLRSRNSMTAGQISEKLEISVRTVYRYIDSLCASGVPVVAEPGHDGGYRLTEGFREAPLFFEPDELKSLFHAASFARGTGYPYEKDLTKALEKIRHHLTKDQQEYLERHMSGFDVLPIHSGHSLAAWLRQLEQAVADGKTFDLLYNKGQCEKPSKRRIDPYGLFYRDKYWYVVAHCHLRNGLRTFRVDRILDLSAPGLFFERPSDFSIQDYIDQQWGYQWEADEPTIRVQIKGEQESIDYLCQYFYHCLVEQDKNRAYFKINVDQVENFLPGFLVSFGTSIQVMEPGTLRAAMAKEARKLEKYYQTHDLP
ncbi:MAG TPA: YafY family protein [Bacillales bacterium]|nr:YafY family protein [Bacillales bacterium]